MTEQKRKQKVQQNIVKEPAATYARNVEIPTFFGQPMLKGEFTELKADSFNPSTPTLFLYPL